MIVNTVFRNPTCWVVPALIMYLQEPQYSDGDIAQKLLEHEVDKRSTFVLGLLALNVLILFFSPSATCIACYVNLTSSRESVEEKHKLYLYWDSYQWKYKICFALITVRSLCVLRGIEFFVMVPRSLFLDASIRYCKPGDIRFWWDQLKPGIKFLFLGGLPRTMRQVVSHTEQVWWWISVEILHLHFNIELCDFFALENTRSYHRQRFNDD